jgi:predicted HicB family RNase H-like nuclease
MKNQREKAEKRLDSAAKAIREDASQLLAQGTSAVDFSERFFGPSGRLRELWASDSERSALVQSELFKWLQERLADLRRKEAALFADEAAKLSGRLTVVVPRSLHAALKREAVLEGVSLSELIRMKLTVSLADCLSAAGVRRHSA